MNPAKIAQRILLSLLVLVCLVALYAFRPYWVPLLAYRHWPPITDSAKLRHEAAILCKTAAARNDGLARHEGLPKSAWPDGIAALHPGAVFAAPDVVTVMLPYSNGDHWPRNRSPYGYQIVPDTVSASDGGITKFGDK